MPRNKHLINRAKLVCMGESCLQSCVQTSLRLVCTHDLGQDSPIQTPCSVNKSYIFSSNPKSERKYILHTIKKTISITFSLHCFSSFWQKKNITGPNHNLVEWRVVYSHRQNKIQLTPCRAKTMLGPWHSSIQNCS